MPCKSICQIKRSAEQAAPTRTGLWPAQCLASSALVLILVMTCAAAVAQATQSGSVHDCGAPQARKPTDRRTCRLCKSGILVIR